MNQGMFTQPNTNRAFGNMPQMQTNEEPENFIEVMLGTAAESFIDTATFGLWQPDIIDDASVANSRIASTIGNVAGSLAGFLPSYGVAFKGGQIGMRALKETFSLFNFSSKIYRKAEAINATVQVAHGAGKIGAFAPLAMKGFNTNVPAFTLYDTAREFIQQTKDNNYDLDELSKAAVGGAITGFFTGSVAYGFAHESPIKQMLSMGSAFALSDAIVSASDGEDVLSMDYFRDSVLPTFFTGMVMGAINSKGWKQKRVAGAITDTMRGEKYLKEMSTKKYKNEEVFSESQMDINQVFTGEYEFAGIINTIEKMTGKKIPDLMKNLNPEQAKAFDTFYNNFKKQWGTELNTGKARLHQFAREIGWKEQEYRQFLKEQTGKTSSIEFDAADFDKVFAGIDAMGKDMQSALKTISGMRPAGVLEKYFRPAWNLTRAMGVGDLTDTISIAKSMQLVERDIVSTMAEGMRKNWNMWWTESNMKSTAKPLPKENVPFAAKAFGKLSNIVTGKASITEAERDLARRIETGDSSGLNDKLKGVFDLYNWVTDIYLQRVNSVRVSVGQDPLPKKEYYMRHVIDLAKLRKGGAKRGELPQPTVFENIEGARTSKLKTESTEMFRQSNLPIIEDPFYALKNMVYDDLKIIYLREPNLILQNQLTGLRKAGLLDSLIEKDINNYVNLVIWEQPTGLTSKANAQVVRFLEQNKVGKAIDKFFLDSGNAISSAPVNAFAALWSNAASKAFLGANPKQAVLNTLQFINGMGFTESKYYGMAMTRKRPQMLEELLEKYGVYNKMGVGHSIEMIETMSSSVEKAAFKGFSGGGVKAIQINQDAAFYSVLDKIAKGKKGWASPEGIALRNEAKAKGNKKWNELLTETEKINLVQELDFQIAQRSNFLYNPLGTPMIYRSGVARPFFSLTSYSMNYYYNYLHELAYRFAKGKPSWTKDMDGFELSGSERLGIFKHLLGVGMTTALLAKVTGIDYSKMSGVGVMQFQPSPLMTLVSSLPKLYSENEEERNEAKRALGRSVPVPYVGFARSTKRVLKGEKDVMDVLFYKKYEPKKKRANAAFQGFQGYNNKAFKGF